MTIIVIPVRLCKSPPSMGKLPTLALFLWLYLIVSRFLRHRKKEKEATDRGQRHQEVGADLLVHTGFARPLRPEGPLLLDVRPSFARQSRSTANTLRRKASRPRRPSRPGSPSRRRPAKDSLRVEDQRRRRSHRRRLPSLRGARRQTRRRGAARPRPGTAPSAPRAPHADDAPLETRAPCVAMTIRSAPLVRRRLDDTLARPAPGGSFLDRDRRVADEGRERNSVSAFTACSMSSSESGSEKSCFSRCPASRP